MLNILKRELHLRYLLNDDTDSNPLIRVFLLPLERQAKKSPGLSDEIVRPVSKNDLKEDRRHR